MRAHLKLHAGLNLHHADAETHEEAEPVIFGFWIFLMSDLILFALLFATYASMSAHGVADGPAPGDVLELRNPFIETMLLLASSFAFGIAGLSLKYGDGAKKVALWMAVSGLLGAGFVAMEIGDFITLVQAHDAPPQVSGFLSSLWLLVGTHGAHVTSAIIWMLILFVQMATLGLTSAVKLRIMRLALFWHMLDVVWIGIFTFVFLFGVAT